MSIHLFSRLATLVAACSLLSACVVGQQLRLDSTPQQEDDLGQGRTVVVAVEDQRPEVVSGEEKPWYIGKYRAALGNPWDVTTEGKVPLADQLAADLVEELASMGFASGPGGRQLSVLINEWNFTGYQNGRFWYALEVSALDASGEPVATSSLGDEMEIKGTFTLGARGGFERDMPGIYAGIIAAVVRDNPEIREALAR